MAMDRKAFDEAWAKLDSDGRFQWAKRELKWDVPYADEMFFAFRLESELQRRGKADEYGLTIQALIEEAFEYGSKSRGSQYYRLAHADAEVRCKAALMVVLGVKP